MHRWDFERMLRLAHQLFAKLHKRKRFSNPNHDIHHLARNSEDWIPNLVQSLIDDRYATQPSRRFYFEDEVVDQLEIEDRVAHHVLLKELKPTFKHVVHPSCFHMAGPTGVKRATQKIAQALETNDFHYLIRADIKSFYRSIPHYKLIQDIKKIYQDPKIVHMLEDVILNPIDTPRGYINPHTGIALREPLSQLFSAIYLRPVDSAFDGMDVVYARYQDDLIVLCKTRAQFNRCRRKLTHVLKERRLELSRKKSRWGRLSNEFHFLGIKYSGAQTPNKTTRIFDIENRENKVDNIQNRTEQNRTEQNRIFAIQKFNVKNLCKCHFMHEHFAKPESRYD